MSASLRHLDGRESSRDGQVVLQDGDSGTADHGPKCDSRGRGCGRLQTHVRPVSRDQILHRYTHTIYPHDHAVRLRIVAAIVELQRKLVSGQGAELDSALNQRRLVTQAIDARADRVGRHALAGYGCCSDLVSEDLPDTALDFWGIVGFRYEQAVIAQIACGFRGSGHPGGHDHFDAGPLTSNPLGQRESV